MGPYSIVFREGHHPFIVMDGVEGKKHLWTDSCTCKLIHVRASTYIQKTYCIVHPPYFYRKLMVMNNYTDREAAYTLDLLPITPTWHTLVWYEGNLWKKKKTMRNMSRRMHHFCQYFFSPCHQSLWRPNDVKLTASATLLGYQMKSKDHSFHMKCCLLSLYGNWSILRQ